MSSTSSIFFRTALSQTALSSSIYYQNDPTRLAACPLTIHALLHVADSILLSGPVWASWAFPMERYCGILKPAIRSRRFPFAALDHYILDIVRLTQLKVVYDARKPLALCTPLQDHSHAVPGCAFTRRI